MCFSSSSACSQVLCVGSLGPGDSWCVGSEGRGERKGAGQGQNSSKGAHRSRHLVAFFDFGYKICNYLMSILSLVSACLAIFSISYLSISPLSSAASSSSSQVSVPQFQDSLDAALENGAVATESRTSLGGKGGLQLGNHGPLCLFVAQFYRRNRDHSRATPIEKRQHKPRQKPHRGQPLGTLKTDSGLVQKSGSFIRQIYNSQWVGLFWEA